MPNSNLNFSQRLPIKSISHPSYTSNSSPTTLFQIWIPTLGSLSSQPSITPKLISTLHLTLSLQGWNISLDILLNLTMVSLLTQPWFVLNTLLSHPTMVTLLTQPWFNLTQPYSLTSPAHTIWISNSNLPSLSSTLSFQVKEYPMAYSLSFLCQVRNT